MRKWNERATRVTVLLLAVAMTASAAGCGNEDAGRERNGSEIQGTVSINGNAEAEATSRVLDGEAVKEEDTTGQEMQEANASSEPSSDSADAVESKDAVKSDAACRITDFGLRLLGLGMEEASEVFFLPYASMPKSVYDESLEDGNILISPLSVLSALTMTANGAKGETLSQMEEAFGISVPELSAYLADYQRSLPTAEQYKLNMANAIWFTADERFTVGEDFLKKNEELFESGIHRVTFDSAACKEINDWVKDNTDGMIEGILDEISPEAVMYLVNALAFDAEWENIYHTYEVQAGEFTKEDGTVINVDMMYSEESQYLEDAHATGFLKYYADRRYAYAALLPEEGMSVAEYVATLDGERLQDILTNSAQLQVNAAIPKYESEYGVEMSHILKQLGMEDAFDSAKADFSGMGRSLDGNIFISRVLHKTFIAVDERGTKAGAATAVEMGEGGAMLEEDVRTVYLDRPFLYMIIDCESNLPVFIGTVEGMEGSGQ